MRPALAPLHRHDSEIFDMDDRLYEGRHLFKKRRITKGNAYPMDAPKHSKKEMSHAEFDSTPDYLCRECKFGGR